MKRKCEYCGANVAYNDARFCGAGCSAAYEMKLPKPLPAPRKPQSGHMLTELLVSLFLVGVVMSGAATIYAAING